MLTILEDSSTNYQNRTEVNAREADVTIAIATVHNSPGEILTRNMAKKHNKLFIGISPHDDVQVKSHEVIDVLKNKFGNVPIKINIAGNGLKTSG